MGAVTTALQPQASLGGRNRTRTDGLHRVKVIQCLHTATLDTYDQVGPLPTRPVCPVCRISSHRVPRTRCDDHPRSNSPHWPKREQTLPPCKRSCPTVASKRSVPTTPGVSLAQYVFAVTLPAVRKRHLSRARQRSAGVVFEDARLQTPMGVGGPATRRVVLGRLRAIAERGTAESRTDAGSRSWHQSRFVGLGTL
jgi:hypothetical protein